MSHCVITGMGLVSAQGIGPAREVWLRGGHERVDLATEFKPKEVLGRRVKHLDRLTQFAAAASHFALEDAKAGNPQLELDPLMHGVAIGTAYGPLQSLTKCHDAVLKRGPRGINPIAFANSSPNTVPGWVSIFADARGPNITHVSGCTAQVDALLSAVLQIQQGAAASMLVGAGDALTDAIEAGVAATAAANQIPIGSVPAEGAGVALVEAADRTERGPKSVLATILGIASRTSHSKGSSSEPRLIGVLNVAAHRARIGVDELRFIAVSGAAPRYIEALQEAVPKAECFDVTTESGVAFSASGAFALAKAVHWTHFNGPGPAALICADGSGKASSAVLI